MKNLARRRNRRKPAKPVPPPSPPSNPYKERDKILEGMGFRSYRDYLASPLWKAIRERVFLRDDFTCKACHTNKRLQVHHSEYTLANLSGQSLRGLHAVCPVHHYRAEFTPEGEKRTLEAANRKLRIKGRRPKKAKGARVAPTPSRALPDLPHQPPLSGRPIPAGSCPRVMPESPMMPYLVRKIRPDAKIPPKKMARFVAHIWDGNDTRCQMWSTNGITKKNNYEVVAIAEYPICENCRMFGKE